MDLKFFLKQSLLVGVIGIGFVFYIIFLFDQFTVPDNTLVMGMLENGGIESSDILTMFFYCLMTIPLLILIYLVETGFAKFLTKKEADRGTWFCYTDLA